MHLFVGEVSLHVVETHACRGLSVRSVDNVCAPNEIPSSRKTLWLNPGPERISTFLQNQFTQHHNTSHVTLLVDDKRKVKECLKEDKFLKAAGGLVSHKEKGWLLIYRHQFWDLPKGKLEDNETMTHCAKREVEEECGVQVDVKEKLCKTYHGYLTHSGRKAWKQTNWYHMRLKSDKHMRPQKEEDIDKVQWVPQAEALQWMNQGLGRSSIQHVLYQALCQTLRDS